MIKYILPLILISSPLIANTNYICNHSIAKGTKIIEEGVQDSYIVISDSYLGYTVGNHPDNEIRKIEFDHEEGIFTDTNTFFSKAHKTLTELKNGNSLMLDNCKEVKL